MVVVVVAMAAAVVVAVVVAVTAMVTVVPQRRLGHPHSVLTVGRSLPELVELVEWLVQLPEQV